MLPPLAVRVTACPAHTEGTVGVMFTTGAGFTVTVTVLDGPLHPPPDALTAYTPWFANVTSGMLGLAEVEEKPLGPVHWKEMPATGVAERFNVSPTQSVMGPPTMGAAGSGVTESGVLDVVVPHALLAAAVMVKFPDAGYTMVPGSWVFALEGFPPVRVQAWEVIGEPQAVKVADGATLCPSQIPFTAFTETTGGAPTVTT